MKGTHGSSVERFWEQPLYAKEKWDFSYKIGTNKYRSQRRLQLSNDAYYYIKLH